MHRAWRAGGECTQTLAGTDDRSGLLIIDRTWVRVPADAKVLVGTPSVRVTNVAFADIAGEYHDLLGGAEVPSLAPAHLSSTGVGLRMRSRRNRVARTGRRISGDSLDLGGSDPACRSTLHPCLVARLSDGFLLLSQMTVVRFTHVLSVMRRALP